MARSIDTIQTEIINAVNAQPDLAGLSNSRRSIWRLWTYVTAYIIGIFEQTNDVFKAEVEDIQSKATAATAPWIQDKVFKFQYSATDPQVLTLDSNLTPVYPVLNADLRIVTRCSVKSDLSNNVKIKTAKSEPPQALVSGELSALQSYINTICPPGINYLVTSGDPDRLFIHADIYYLGQYSAVIKDNVVAAVNSFLANLPFDGQLLVSDLEVAIKAVPGVKDILFKDVRARGNATPFASAVYLVQDNKVIQKAWNSVAGYLITEDDSGNTINDSLSYIAS